MEEIVDLCDINAVLGPEIVVVTGAHFQHLNGIRIFYTLRIAMRGTADTFLIKFPVEVGNAKCSEINRCLSKEPFVLVIVENLVLKKYTFPAKDGQPEKIVYSGKATDFDFVKSSGRF
ncbi:MAG: hypothetical protein E7299_06850 [Lachnospiraceae bacterium]|nr:hypothetical protein [Lachnospiraceae bacterium]